jgi:hypothetical protein
MLKNGSMRTTGPLEVRHIVHFLYDQGSYFLSDFRLLGCSDRTAIASFASATWATATVFFFCPAAASAYTANAYCSALLARD